MKRITPEASTLPAGENGPLQAIDIKGQKIGSETLPRSAWEQCNEATWKLLASETGRAALGYVIDVGWMGDKSRWLARVEDKSFGPTTLVDAKSAVEAMVARRPVDGTISLSPAEAIHQMNTLAAGFLDFAGLAQ
jgi:hypothetical protein